MPRAVITRDVERDPVPPVVEEEVLNRAQRRARARGRTTGGDGVAARIRQAGRQGAAGRSNRQRGGTPLRPRPTPRGPNRRAAA